MKVEFSIRFKEVPLQVDKKIKFLKRYKKILLMMVLVILLSTASTVVSFFRIRSYGWGFWLEEENCEYIITQHGFPYGWYAIIRFIRGGHLETETIDFRLEVFLIDTIIYIIAYSMIVRIVLWGYHRYVLKDLNWKDFAKYFVHGIVFSILFSIFAIVWVFALVFLASLGFIIGLIIGLGLLFLIVGFLNSIITLYLWFEVKTSFWDLFFHGLVLFIVLLILNVITVNLPSLAFPGTATRVVTLIISSFLYGFVAKRIAGFWEQEYREGIPKAIEAEWRDKRL